MQYNRSLSSPAGRLLVGGVLVRHAEAVANNSVDREGSHQGFACHATRASCTSLTQAGLSTNRAASAPDVLTILMRCPLTHSLPLCCAASASCIALTTASGRSAEWASSSS